MRGKYSPTVSAAYAADQEWWHKYSRETETSTLYDPEGYDSYGYNAEGYDRAGHHETDYIASDIDVEPDDIWSMDGENFAYNQALDDWGFDGVKPVRRG